MEAIIVYWGYLVIMEKKAETTIINSGYLGILEKNGNYYYMLGLFRENGKENGSYWGRQRLGFQNLGFSAY